ncbi:MAG: hypothetical protein LRY36_00330 [Alphaproteobacteria bacterium]|nr:hypothetical protein [Alphaproteobacteria bacterium]
MFPGKKQVYIGIGGGSDCVQAAILAILSGNPACVISIRRDKLSSQTAKDDVGGKRTVNNHGGEVGGAGTGVFRITPDTCGSGRFLEFLPASHLPTYLVIDAQDGKLTDQVQIALNDFGVPDTVIAIDTGGDALYRVEQAEDVIGKTTPDQDISSLLALSKLQGVRLYSGIVAKGIDTPEYADDVLKAAEAQYVTLSEDQIATVLDLYALFALDGSNPDRYGKTPFAWQAALRGETGQVRIPLPDHAINHPTNPWNPVVSIGHDTAGIYVMELPMHVAAISQTPPTQQPRCDQRSNELNCDV